MSDDRPQGAPPSGQAGSGAGNVTAAPASGPTPGRGAEAGREAGRAPEEATTPLTLDDTPVGAGEALPLPAPKSESPPIVERAFGRFELLLEMGSGGMATLYLARIRGPEDFEKLFAIKKIHPHLAKRDSFVRMFLDEARLAARIHHPNVVTTFDLGRIDGAYFIAMEYVHGQNVTDVLLAAAREPSKLDWPESVRVVADAAAGLHAAHELRGHDGMPLGVVHRDISPQNLLISYDGAVKVTDFGIAFAAEKLEQTESGFLKGKVSYMSPEQTRGERLDRRSDVFALGVVLWEMLCLERLFRGPNEAAALLLAREARVPKPRTRKPELPVALEKIVLKALAKDPAERFASAEELSEALEALLVAEGRVVTRKHVAAALGSLFADRKELKDRQIQDALQNAAHSPVRRVGMLGASSEDLELPAAPVAAPSSSRASVASGRSRLWVAASTVAALVATLLVLFLGPWRGPRSAPPGEKPAPVAQAPARKRPQAELRRDRAAAPVPARPHSKVTLRITVTPREAPVEVVFRGAVYRGATFERSLDRSLDAERLTVRAAGYAPETVVIVPSVDNEIPVALQKLAAPRPTAPRPVWRPRPRRPGGGGLRDLPD